MFPAKIVLKYYQRNIYDETEVLRSIDILRILHSAIPTHLYGTPLANMGDILLAHVWRLLNDGTWTPCSSKVEFAPSV